MTKQTRNIFIHIIGCIVFLFFPIIFSPDLRSEKGILTIDDFQKDFCTYALLVLFFYFNYFILIPKFYFHKKYPLFFALTFVCYILVAIIPDFIIPRSNYFPPFNNEMQGSGPPPPNFEQSIFFFHLGHYIPHFLTVSLFTFILKISDRWKQAEKEKVNAELSYLKAQMNPHFLFNTLNSIYALAIEKSDFTAPAIVKLSGMMRYVITEANGDFVWLDKEINYITDYIELQRIRLDNTVKLTYSISGIAAGKKIAPLILIPFVENAFKYGVNSEENSAINIDIKITTSEITLKVKNNKVNTNNGTSNSRLGIETTKNRLQIMYPAKHNLVVNDNEDIFSVLLQIILI